MTAQSTHIQIANALAGVQSRERRRMAQQLAAERGVSVQTIYTWAKQGGFTSGRARRSDAGAIRLDVTQDQLATLAKIIHASHTEKHRIPLPAHEAIRLAEANGIIAPGQVTEDYLNAWMRRRRLSKRDAVTRTPHTPLMSKYPNHCHMIDASQCAQWYLRDDGHVAHQRRGMDVYKNKSGNSNKLSRLMLVDHYSGAFFVWYATSETALDWIEFIYLAWADKSHLAKYWEGLPDDEQEQLAAIQFPFRGLPDMVYADNGSPIRAATTQTVLDRLGITFDTHLPFRPRAKGCNETMQRHWERWFESDLHFQKAPTLQQLNAWAYAKCALINAERPFTRTQRPRFDFWCEQLTTLREAPQYEFYRTFAVSPPDTRKVGMDGVIRYKPSAGSLPEETSGFYRVPDVNLRGTEVEVNYCLYDFPKIRVVSRRTGQVFELNDLHRNAAGFLTEISATIGENYKAPADTEIQASFKNYGFEVSPKTGLWVASDPVTLDKVHDTRPADAPTAPVEPIAFPTPETSDVIVAPTYISAKKTLLERLGARRTDDLHPVQADILNAMDRRGYTQAELDTVYNQLIQVDPATVITLNEGAAQA